MGTLQRHFGISSFQHGTLSSKSAENLGLGAALVWLRDYRRPNVIIELDSKEVMLVIMLNYEIFFLQY